MARGTVSKPEYRGYAVQMLHMLLQVRDCVQDISVRKQNSNQNNPRQKRRKLCRTE